MIPYSKRGGFRVLRYVDGHGRVGNAPGNHDHALAPQLLPYKDRHPVAIRGRLPVDFDLRNDHGGDLGILHRVGKRGCTGSRGPRSIFSGVGRGLDQRRAFPGADRAGRD